ncbi:hypothetical protein PInf_013230 [Phytophthora infestans]|nr:hypothetical protein PInf_013230 [Phytophthora infestans]
MWRNEAKKSDPEQQPPLATSDDAQRPYRHLHLRNNQMEVMPTVSQGAIHDERPAPSSVAAAASSRIGGDRNWSTRIRASIARLMGIDGVSLDPVSFAKLIEEKRAAKVAEQTFHERVDRLQAASEAAHKEHCERLRGIYPASTAKKMRFSTASHPSLSAPVTLSSASSALCQPRHEALDALAVAAATENLSDTLTVSKEKRTNRRQNSFSLGVGAGTDHNPVRVHDPELAKAVNKLSDKLAQLLGQLQATSDATTAESILAAAAAIALEATEMRRNEEVALARMVEIEKHRQHIMQGLLEYEMRKEQRELNESSKRCTASSHGSLDSPKDRDANADGKQA